MEFWYALGKVLGTQDRLTLRLVTHHCVLHLNPIKNYSNTCMLDSHTHTNIHLTNNLTFLTLNTYLSIYPNKREPKVLKKTLIIHLKQSNNLNMATSISSNKTYQKQNINTLETLIIHLKTLTQMHKHC